MNTFFQELADTMKDRQEMRFNVKKIDGELVIIAVPNFKEDGKNIHITGSPADIDANFISDIKKPLEVAAKYSSNAEEVAKEEEEEAEEEKKEEAAAAESKKKREDAKKKPVKPTKKPSKKTKATPAKEEKEEQEEEESETNSPESETKPDESVTETELQPREFAEGEMLAEGDLPAGSPDMKSEPVSYKDLKGIDKNDIEEQPAQKAEDENKKLFNGLMADGDRLFSERKYKEAETAYSQALELMPENEKAKKEQKKAAQWVRAMENIK